MSFVICRLLFVVCHLGIGYLSLIISPLLPAPCSLPYSVSLAWKYKRAILMHRDAMPLYWLTSLMYQDAMPLYRLTLFMHPDAMPLYWLTLLMYRDAMPLYRVTLLMHPDAM